MSSIRSYNRRNISACYCVKRRRKRYFCRCYRSCCGISAPEAFIGGEMRELLILLVVFLLFSIAGTTGGSGVEVTIGRVVVVLPADISLTLRFLKSTSFGVSQRKVGLRTSPG